MLIYDIDVLKYMPGKYFMKKIVLFLFLLSGCVNGYDKIQNKFKNDFENGKFEIAANEMRKATIDNKEQNNLYLGGLQCGTAFLWSNDVENSDKCFAVSDDVLTNKTDGISNYQIKNYEKIMLKTYSGINAIVNDDEYAKQIFNQMYALQSENIGDSGAEIAKLREQFNKDKEKLKKIGIDDIGDLDKISEQIAAKDLSSEIVPMKDFANPYATWLSAIFDAVNGDFSNAENYMKRVEMFAPNNKYVRDDVNAVKRGSVFVVLENGMLGKLKIRSIIPTGLQYIAQPLKIYGINSGIKLTVPDMNPGTLAVEKIYVNSDGKTVETEFLASIDSVAKTELDKHKTDYILQSIAFEVNKIALAAAVMVATHKVRNKEENSFGKMAAEIAILSIMNSEKNWDLRSWGTLPREIQIARVNMPKNKKITINGGIDVDIPKDAKNAIVFVRMPSPVSKPSIVVGKLN